MQRVVQLLDPRSEEFSERQAWLRLWLLAGDQPRLTRWERQRDAAAFAAQVQDLFERIDDEQAVPLALAEDRPLALIEALDAWLAAVQRPAARSAVGHAHTLYTEDGAEHWLVPVVQAAHGQTATAKQATQRSRWFRHHVAIPRRTSQGIEVTLQASRGPLDQALAAIARQPGQPLKAWAAHFNDGSDVQWSRSVGAAGDWRTVSVEPAAQRLASIADTLRRASDSGATVVVFPEFTVDLQQRQAIIDHLIRQPEGSVQLVVAGSFHEPVPGGQPLDAYNTAPVLAVNGVELLSHRKLRLFGDEAHGAECVQIGNSLHVLHTPLGGMTVLICKDYLDGDDRVRTALHEVQLDWVWVPSYGNATTLKLHKQRARELAKVKVGLSTLVAQTQNTALDKLGPPLPGFGHAAGQAAEVDVGIDGGLVCFSWSRLPSPPSPQNAKAKPKPALKRIQ